MKLFLYMGIKIPMLSSGNNLLKEHIDLIKYRMPQNRRRRTKYFVGLIIPDLIIATENLKNLQK